MFKKNWIFFIVLIALLCIYYPLLGISLYWDATIHGLHAKKLIYEWWAMSDAAYPIFYYYISAYLFLIFWESGFNLQVFAGVFLILVYSYLIFFRTSRKFSLSCIWLIIIWLSPKLIFYSYRLYQEIFMTWYAVLIFYYYLRFSKKNSKWTMLILSLFLGFILALKQQWLFIFYMTFFVYASIRFFYKKFSINNLLKITIIPLVIGFPFYGILFHTKWFIVPWNEDFLVIKIINTIGKKVFFFQQKNEYVDPRDFCDIYDCKFMYLWQAQWTDRQQTFFKTFTTYKSFNNIHSIFWSDKNSSPHIYFIYLFIWIIFLFLKRSYISLFVVLFLFFNYILFQRNFDQARYHLFIPFVISFLFLASFGKMSRRNLNIQLFIFFIIFWVLWAVISVKQWIYSSRAAQIYSSSKGWIDSIMEAWLWLQNNTPRNVKIFHVSGNELAYYSERLIMSDWYIYQYPSTQIDSYFKENNYDLIVIFQSQIVLDRNWQNMSKIPESFLVKIKEMYPLIYTTTKGDIYIFSVKKL